MDIDVCFVDSVCKVHSEVFDAQPMLCMLRWFIVHLWVCALWLWIYLHQLGLWVSIQGLGYPYGSIGFTCINWGGAGLGCEFS
jgi:hypothetical protein